MKPEAGFDAAMARADHLVTLYELCCDTRHRAVRSDWAASFKKVMHWPAQEKIVRIDGKDRNSMVILRQAVGIDRAHFAHDYVSELLRGAIVAAISALDRYLHDLVVRHCRKVLNQKAEDIPKELRDFAITALDARRAIDRVRRNPSARPGYVVKKAIQARLHREFTFQNPDSVNRAVAMLGVTNFWDTVASNMPGTPPKADVIARLRTIAKRRNQIVHEADLYVKTKAKKLSLRDITLAEAKDAVDWIRELGGAIDVVVAGAV